MKNKAKNLRRICGLFVVVILDFMVYVGIVKT